MQHSLATFVGKVQRTIRRYHLIANGDRVVVAVSGGADSTALALALDALRSKLGCDLILAHVHHGLRRAADRDRDLAVGLADHLGAPIEVASVQVDEGGNLEARARELRYAALHEIATAESCRCIATGHTRDDQAETVLMRLLGGAGSEGLAGIHPCRDDGVIRPLLDCRREETERIARDAGLAVADDEMNHDRRFLRSRVRADVLPLLRDLNDDVVDALARSADHARAAAAIVDAWAGERIDGAGNELDVDLVAAVDADRRGILLRAWIRRIAGAVRVGSRTLAQVEDLAVTGERGKWVDLSARWRIERSADRLVLRAAK